MNAQQIFDIIQEESAYIQYFGLRALTQNSETGEFETAEIGGTVKNSYVWNDGDNTGEEIDGACAIKINEADTRKADTDEIEQAIREMRPYIANAKQVVLLGSDEAEPGEDYHERIMKNAKVLAIWEV